MTPRRRRELYVAPELLELRLLAVAADTLLTALRLQHPTLDELTAPTDPPTLRAARRLAARARRLRAAMSTYRDTLRQMLREPPDDDLPF